MNALCYLDNAATSFPKPREVYRAVDHCLKYTCGNPGRGSHRLARAAAETVYDTREKIAGFLGLENPERVFFTLNATHGLNLLIKGFLKSGDHVLISDLEHNSVWRPVEALSKAGKISYDIFSSKAIQSAIDTDRELGRLYKSGKTRAVICTHASNICSYTLNLNLIGDFCHRHNLLFLVDTAQSAGHLPIDFRTMKMDAISAPGHKGLFGPQGSGFVALSDNLPPELLPLPLMEGGSGYQSLLPEMPELPPERYEAGTVATPAIAGLGAGIGFVEAIGVEAIHAHETKLFLRARDLLSDLPGISIYAPDTPGSVLSFSVSGIPSEEIADAFDRNGICVRAGFHCAALAHRTLKTPPESGSVRLGFGYFNRFSDIDRMARELKQYLFTR